MAAYGIKVAFCHCVGLDRAVINEHSRVGSGQCNNTLVDDELVSKVIGCSVLPLIIDLIVQRNGDRIRAGHRLSGAADSIKRTFLYLIDLCRLVIVILGRVGGRLVDACFCNGVRHSDRALVEIARSGHGQFVRADVLVHVAADGVLGLRKDVAVIRHHNILRLRLTVINERVCQRNVGLGITQIGGDRCSHDGIAGAAGENALTQGCVCRLDRHNALVEVVCLLVHSGFANALIPVAGIVMFGRELVICVNVVFVGDGDLLNIPVCRGFVTERVLLTCLKSGYGEADVILYYR